MRRLLSAENHPPLIHTPQGSSNKRRAHKAHLAVKRVVASSPSLNERSPNTPGKNTADKNAAGKNPPNKFGEMHQNPSPSPRCIESPGLSVSKRISAVHGNPSPADIVDSPSDIIASVAAPKGIVNFAVPVSGFFHKTVLSSIVFQDGCQTPPTTLNHWTPSEGHHPL